MAHKSDTDVDALAPLVLAAGIAILAIAVVVLVVAGAEALRILRRHRGTREGRWLLGATATLLLALGCSLLLLGSSLMAALWLASLSLGLWAAALVVVEAMAGPDLLGATDDVLAPWKPTKRPAG